MLLALLLLLLLLLSLLLLLLGRQQWRPLLAVQWLLLGLGLSLALSLLWKPPSHPLGDVTHG